MSDTKKFCVPVIYTVSGHIVIEAKDMREAHAKAAKLNDEGVDLTDIQDIDIHTECMLNELALLGNDDSVEDEDGDA